MTFQLDQQYALNGMIHVEGLQIPQGAIGVVTRVYSEDATLYFEEYDAEVRFYELESVLLEKV